MKLLEKFLPLRVSKDLFKDIVAYRRFRKLSKRDNGVAARELLEAGLDVLYRNKQG